MPLFNEFGNLNNIPDNHPVAILQAEIHKKVSTLMKTMLESGEITFVESRALQENLTTTTSIACGESILRHAMKVTKKNRKEAKLRAAIVKLGYSA